MKLSMINSAAPDADRAVGDVERWPRPALVMKKQEVDHAPDREPVPDIPEGAAQDQREAEAIHGTAAALQKPGNDNRRA